MALRKAIVFALLVLVVVACALLYLYVRGRGPKPNSARVPPELRPLYEERSKWLEEKLEERVPSEWRPVVFNGHHILASDMMVRNTDEETDRLFLDMLCELGVDSVSLYIFEPNYWKYRDRYDKLFAMIRERGKKLVLHAYTLPKRNEPLDEYFDRLLKFKLFIVERYRPDYFIVLMEPSVIGGVKMPPEKLREFAARAARENKKVSPGTVLAVVVHKGELGLLLYFADVEDLDVIGINVYDVRDLEKVEQAIDYIKRRGKRAWVFETWWIPQKRGKEHYIWFRCCCWQDIASKWIRVMVYFVQRHGLEGDVLSPFFTEQLVYCSGDPYKPFEQQFRELLQSVKAGRRTDVFYAYKRVIEETREKYSRG